MSAFFIIALASFSLIGLEIAWTRIFSAEYYYTFAFLILSLAILGLGLGGLALRLFPCLANKDRLGHYFLLTAFLAVIGPPLVLHLGLDFQKLFTGWAMAGRLVLTIALLSSAFCSGGMAISLLFRQNHREMPRLYMADLAGAGLGVAGVVALMNWVGTPRATVLLALPLLLAAYSVGKRGLKMAAMGLGGAVIAVLPMAPGLIARPRQELAPVVHRHWDATSLIKINRFEDGALNINIDNAANTPIPAFDGNWEAYRQKPSDALLDPKPLMDRMGGSCHFLSIGAGGGRDVLLALRNGASEVHAVEVNPYINHLLQKKGAYYDYTGKLYEDYRVKVATEDARAYVRRFNDHFDLIFSLSSNSFSALASGAFAMSENYIFTTEAMRDYYRALSPRGYLVMEHQFYMPRIVGAGMDALRSLGVSEPERHITVYALPQGRYTRQILVLGKAVLTPEEIHHPFLALEGKPMHREYPDPDAKANPLIGRIIQGGWRSVESECPTALSPTVDNRPFIAMQGRFRNVSFKALKTMGNFEIFGFPVAKITVMAVLGVVLLFVLPLNFLPYLRKTARISAPGWLYFFAIGFGFMSVEVVLIQQYTLFIGASSYTVVVLLFALLLGSGLGSRFAMRCKDSLPFLAVLLWITLDIGGFQPLTHALAGLPLALRMLVTVVWLMPLAFFMGMPFAKGTVRVGELIDWGFAVNGAASVLGSACILLVSFQWGFNAALLVGEGAYLLAMLLLKRPGTWVKQQRAT